MMRCEDYYSLSKNRTLFIQKFLLLLPELAALAFEKLAISDDFYSMFGKYFGSQRSHKKTANSCACFPGRCGHGQLKVTLTWVSYSHAFNFYPKTALSSRVLTQKGSVKGERSLRFNLKL